MMPAVAGPATTFGFRQQEFMQDTAGDFDAGVVEQQLTPVDVPSDAAAGGELEFAVVQVLGDQGGQLA